MLPTLVPRFAIGAKSNLPFLPRQWLLAATSATRSVRMMARHLATGTGVTRQLTVSGLTAASC